MRSIATGCSAPYPADDGANHTAWTIARSPLSAKRSMNTRVCSSRPEKSPKAPLTVPKTRPHTRSAVRPVVLGACASEAAEGDRAEGQDPDRVEDAPEERRGHERVVGCVARLDQHCHEHGVDDAEAAPSDRNHRAGPESNREGGERIRRRQLAARDADEAERRQKDQVSDEEVRRDTGGTQPPTLA